MSLDMRQCVRCKDVKHRREFAARSRTCDACRRAADAPKPTEAQWQQTVTSALSTFGWDWMHVRRTRGKGGLWTTSTSQPGWPDLVALRGGLIVGIELKSETGRPTAEQLEWLARFSRLIGGRAWLVTPSDPAWDTFVAWIRDPMNAPRRHGW